MSLRGPEIIRKSCLEGARSAEGLVVIIDVFRAFTCTPLFFHFGAERVILEADPDKAITLKHDLPHSVLVGEVDEVPIKGGDMGNSPVEIILKGSSFFKGKTVIHRTTAGVIGVTVALGRAAQVILGSFVMAQAIAEFIKESNTDKVTLVAMGTRAKAPAPEDEACADYIEHLVNGKSYDHVEVLKQILFQETAQKFIMGKRPYLPREDPVFCLQRDLFNYVLMADREDGLVQIRKAISFISGPKS